MTVMPTLTGKIGPMRPLQRVEADSKTGPDPGVDLSSDMKALNMVRVLESTIKFVQQHNLRSTSSDP